MGQKVKIAAILAEHSEKFQLGDVKMKLVNIWHENEIFCFELSC